MANQEHLDLLKQRSTAWNVWRKRHPGVKPDLAGANLSKADLSNINLFNSILSSANLSEANLSGTDLSFCNLINADFSSANLSNAKLTRADLTGADLTGADLTGAKFTNARLTNVKFANAILTGADLALYNFSGSDLSNSDFSYANLTDTNLSYANLIYTNLSYANLSYSNLMEATLSEANLSGATLIETDFSYASLNGANLTEANLTNAVLMESTLSGADLSGADLSRADLSGTILVGANLTNATLKDCKIYGISAWDVQLGGAEQLNLRITPDGQSDISVDNLKIAQFLYLLLNNKEIRDVINTLTTKSVLILGRFTPERKAVLDALREALRQHNYLPILFDFDPAHTQTVRETVSTLAHLSHFIIADLTNPSSIPEELETIIPTLAVPIQPLLETTQKREFSMFKGYGVYDWVLPIYCYADLTGLLENIQEKVINPATQKARELEAKKVRLNQEPFEQTT